MRLLFGYDGIASGTGECVRERIRIGGGLLWPEVVSDQKGGLEDPGMDDLNLDAVGEMWGRRG